MLLIPTILKSLNHFTQTNYIVQHDDPTTPPPQFSLHQLYMTNDDIPNQTSPLYNVQPTSHTSEKRIFLLYHTLLKI